MTGQGNGQLVEVHVSGYVRNLLQQIQFKYSLAGKGEEFLATLQALHDRLRKDPKGVGEALYDLPALRLVVYVCVISTLAVHFGIHEDKPLVFLKWARDLSP